MIMLVLMRGTEVLKSAYVHVPVVRHMVMAVAVRHRFVGVLLPLGLGIGHPSLPSTLLPLTVRRSHPPVTRVLTGRDPIAAWLSPAPCWSVRRALGLGDPQPQKDDQE